MAMNYKEVTNKSDIRSRIKSKKEQIKAKFYKVDGDTLLYTVNSSKKDKQYLVKIQLLDLSNNKLSSLKSALDGNLKISCTCPAFLYQGYKYISYKKRVGIDKETRAPNIKNPNQIGLACKHILVALEQIKSDYSLIYNNLKLSQTSASKTDNTTNNSDESNEQDLKIIDDFKEECLKLYDEYTKYIASNDADDFINSKLYSGINPTALLDNLSKQTSKMIKQKFDNKFDNLENLIKFIETRINSFKVLLKSGLSSITNKINYNLKSTTESIINNIILNLISEYHI